MFRISKSFFTIMLMAVIAIGATAAYFTDSETVVGNTFAAGTLDLKVDDTDNPTNNINISDLKPGESREFTWVLKNTGSLEGIPSITFGNVENFENSCIDPESDVDFTPDFGELGDRLRVKAEWQQRGGFKTIRLSNNSATARLNDISGITAGLGLLTGSGTDNAIPHLSMNEQVTIRFTVSLPDTVGNIIQSDSASLDITFNLNQS